jgi:hypothetical protein
VTYLWLTDLDACFTAAGIPYTEINAHPSDVTGSSSWRTRGRPASTGQFNPIGILCHHTASPAGTSDAADINVIMYGNGSAPGPISQLYIGRSATLYLVAAGRCNHGGSGAFPGGQCQDQNAACLGIEVGNDGIGERWSDAVTDLYADTVAALLDHYGADTSQVWLHASLGPACGNFKIDPAGPWQRQPDLPGYGAGTWDLDIWRQFVDEHRGGPPPSPLPPPTHEEGASMPLTYVVAYGDIPGLAGDGAIYEVAGGRRRHVTSDEWYEVLKGVVMGPDGSMPLHSPWQPVAFVTNGYVLAGLPETG